MSRVTREPFLVAFVIFFFVCLIIIFPCQNISDIFELFHMLLVLVFTVVIVNRVHLPSL